MESSHRFRRGLMPAQLVVVIGANGAGKSTWCREHRDELPTRFYDADSIAEGLGSYNDPARQREARAIVDERIEQHFERSESFGFESTFSGSSRPRIVRRAADLDYSSYAIFIGTQQPDLNIYRVAARVAARTGHHVPELEIRRRWAASQDNLVRAASLFDRIRLVDNSEDSAWTVADYRSARRAALGRSHLDVNAPLWANGLSERLMGVLYRNRP